MARDKRGNRSFYLPHWWYSHRTKHKLEGHGQRQEGQSVVLFTTLVVLTSLKTQAWWTWPETRGAIGRSIYHIGGTHIAQNTSLRDMARDKRGNRSFYLPHWWYSHRSKHKLDGHGQRQEGQSAVLFTTLVALTSLKTQAWGTWPETRGAIGRFIYHIGGTHIAQNTSLMDMARDKRGNRSFYLPHWWYSHSSKHKIEGHGQRQEGQSVVLFTTLVVLTSLKTQAWGTWPETRGAIGRSIYHIGGTHIAQNTNR